MAFHVSETHIEASSNGALLPEALDRTSEVTWAKAGKKNISEVAWERVKRILKEHSPEPLYEGVGERLSQIVKDAEAELVKEG